MRTALYLRPPTAAGMGDCKKKGGVGSRYSVDQRLLFWSGRPTRANSGIRSPSFQVTVFSFNIPDAAAEHCRSIRIFKCWVSPIAPTLVRARRFRLGKQ